MTYPYQRRRRLPRAGTLSFVVLSLLVASAAAGAAIRTPAPWRVESFCHRGAAPAHRCLVRARQGIIVFQLVELPSPPAIRWDNDIAVLTSGAGGNARQLRFYQPPQRLSTPFAQARAYDTTQQLVASVSSNHVRVVAMFGGSGELASLTLPRDTDADSLQLHFEGHTLLAAWRDSAGQQQQQTLQVPVHPAL
ncbi:MAG: hypothetical protein WDW36_008218 [Sanguina aurantia]